jgi:hypothetical protein
MRIIKPYISLEMLKVVYYSNFNSIMNYVLPFWGTSPHSKIIFWVQKRIVRIIMGCRKEVSCRNVVRKLKILPLISQYILSLMMFIIKNKPSLQYIQRFIMSTLENIETFINLH